MENLKNKFCIFFNNEQFLDIKKIAQIISNNNGVLYLVGGCVRDIILDIPPQDLDFCVVGMDSKKFETLFPTAIKQGKNFPVYVIKGYEFALARKEIKSGIKHTDFDFITTSNITINDDLLRRDLTINSIAVNVLTADIVDPLCGINDIKNRILKHSSLAFSEDPLRVYRVARFASQLNFCVDISTLDLMSSMKDDLIHLSVERVFTEFRKALISKHPINFFNILRHTNCLNIHFEEISNLIDVEQPLIYHPEGDAYNHTLEVLERTSNLTNNELIRFGALVHDFGKAVTPKSNWPHHYNHENLGLPIIKNFCQKLKMPSSYLKAGYTACREHMRAGIYERLKPGTKIDLFERVYKDNSLTLKGLEIIANADKNTATNSKNKEIKFAEIAEKIIKNIKLDENDIIKINNSASNPQKRIQLTKDILKSKRVEYLLKLEKEQS